MKKLLGFSKSTICDKINYNGCKIYLEEKVTIKMNISGCLESIIIIYLTRSTRKKYYSAPTEYEINSYRKLSVSLMWKGKATIPNGSLFGSLIQQQIMHLKF